MSDETPAERPFRIFFAMIAAQALFTTMNAFVKLASEDHSVPQIMFFRSVLALIPVIWLILHTGKESGDRFALFRTTRPMGHAWRSITGILAMVCYFGALMTLPLANVTALSFTAPLILTVLSIPMLNEKVGPYRMSAVIVGMLSVLLILGPSIEADREHLSGNIMALAAAVLSAFSLGLIRQMGRTENHLTIVFYFTLSCAVASAIVLPFYWQTPTGANLYFLLMVGLCGSIGQILMTWSYAHAPAAYASAFFYTAIIFAGLLDWVIWDYVIDARTATGCAVIVASGLYILHREVKKKRLPLVSEPPLQD
jgi:drug/metabolite transporter (DMT)-like permease